MRQKIEIALHVTGLMFSVSLAALMAGAQQNPAPPSLQEQLEAQYSLSKVRLNGTVLSAGAVLVVQLDGIRAVSPTRTVVPACIYKDGVLHPPSKGSQIARGAVLGMAKQTGDLNVSLVVGEKVYVSKIDVNLKDEKIGFRIIECDACNGLTQASSLKADVVFAFPSGYLEKVDIPGVEDTIAKVLALDTSTAAAPPTEAQPPPAQPAPELASASLQDQLLAQYQLAKVMGGAITEPGTVLVLQKDGALGVRPGILMSPVVTYQNGKLSSSMPPPLPSPQTGQPQPPMFTEKDTRPLRNGEKVYLSNIMVFPQNDMITYTIHECDACNGVTQPSSYWTVIVFAFAKGYLANAAVLDVEDTIAQVLTIDTAAAAPAQPAPTPAPPAVEQPAPAEAPPAAIKLGQTIEQVVAILGQPEKTVDLGAKKIYVYPDLKITFMNGKVSDVQ
jgi:hypothetical protein